MKVILIVLLFLQVQFVYADNVSEKEFNRAISEVEDLYRPIIETEDFDVVIRGRWENSAVNAYTIYGDHRRAIIINGGIARAKHMTYDGLIMTLCHELGHNFGGLPKKPQTHLPEWSSAEAQSDYYSANKCAKRYFERYYHEVSFDEIMLPIAAHNLCKEEYGEGMEYSICLRTIKGAEAVMKALALEYEGSDQISIATPENTFVDETNTGYPSMQCRLDTYFRGAVCNKSYSDDEYCLRKNGDYNGARPRCWYRPN